MLGFETNDMFSHINTPFWVKDYQNLSLGVVFKINVGQMEVHWIYGVIVFDNSLSDRSFKSDKEIFAILMVEPDS